ncbi:phospholipid/glycerol acyltransferase [Denitrovibrio acetiphilus DSM 12809]|uniref:Phospholipid/glycerol acyltransferase n=2 Tax=Denitrovibrio TaxID=117999 RepID=D4H715_DENA2|nr:phospholipid/glycerol acyltransferase [Denitrovibrio acetiphilus DSM 12809]
MLRFIKLTSTVFLFMVFIAGALILRFYAVSDVNKRRVGAWFVTKMSRLGLKVFGINITSLGDEFLEPAGRIIISNHMSYLDIIIYASIRPSVFVSSVEIQQTPFLGFLAKLGGTFFVERRNPKLVKLEVGNMAELVKEGFNVVLFPEGTSTDGSQILPFRSSLLAAASAAKVDVVPACIRYDEIDSFPFSSENCDKVCWYGDMSFAPHLWNFLKVTEVKTKITFFAPMDSSKSDRKQITQVAHQLISQEYFSAA